MLKKNFSFFLETTLSILTPFFFFLFGKPVCYQFQVASEINDSSAVQGRVYNVKIFVCDTEATVCHWGRPVAYTMCQRILVESSRCQLIKKEHRHEGLGCECISS